MITTLYLQNLDQLLILGLKPQHPFASIAVALHHYRQSTSNIKTEASFKSQTTDSVGILNFF